jgi:hypothetical protein
MLGFGNEHQALWIALKAIERLLLQRWLQRPTNGCGHLTGHGRSCMKCAAILALYPTTL